MLTSQEEGRKGDVRGRERIEISIKGGGKGEERSKKGGRRKKYITLHVVLLSNFLF